MCQTFVHLLILTTLSCLFCAEDETKVTVSCPDHQKAFRDSCYEFVDLQYTFFSAQTWCEQRGGHLAFIPDEETQHFLQRHLDPKTDIWLGAASSASTNLRYSPTAEGPLSWLDGSPISYSNWVSSPQPGAACGHMLRDSGFQWEATKDCNKKLPFICQFESGRSILCAGRNTTLQCGSGQILLMDGGFYGRKNIYYCRSTRSTPATPAQLQCGWVDIVESLTAHCHGRQVCHISEVVNSFGEPCPQLGSYLSLDYHCKDGLTLSVSAVAAVFNDVTISVKWLLHLHLSCKLNTGDNHFVRLHSSEGLESSVVHKYTHPGTFVVAVECTSSDIHITAQKIITIQEPIREFGVIACYAGKLSFHANDCKALYGEPFQIQMEVKAGTDVTYRIQSNEMLLSGSSVVRGNLPQNITVIPEMVKQLWPGCHQLTLYASNMVTFPEVSADLQMCVLEKVAGLQASVLTERNDCLDSPDITVGVSLEQGAPVLLLLSLTGDNITFSETREMITRKDIFHIGHRIQGSVQMKIRAWNVFSSLEVDVDTSAFCDKDSLVEPQQTKSCYREAGKRPFQKKQDGGTQCTVDRNILAAAKSNRRNVKVVIVNEDGNNPKYKEYIIRTSGSSSSSATSSSSEDTSSATTRNPGVAGTGATTAGPAAPATISPGTIVTATVANTPNVATMATTVTRANNAGTAGPVTTSPGTINTASIAATTTTATTATSSAAITATTASIATTISTDTTATTTTIATTGGTSSPATTNNFDSLKCTISPPSGTIFEAFNITCSSEIPCSNCQYCFKTREGKHLRCSETNEAKSVFLPLGDSSSNYNLIITAAAKNSRVVASTTITTQVMDSTVNSSSSVDALKDIVTNAEAQLQKDGLLSGQTVGQIFYSVSNKLNDQSDELKKEKRQKLREQMLDIMIEAVKIAPTKTPEEIQVTTRGLAAVILKGNELSTSAQKNVSDSLLVALNNIQSVLLASTDVNKAPAIIQQAHISVFVNRVTPGNLHTKSINITNCSCPTFSLPKLPSSIFPSDDPVDVRMLSLDKNPFSWNERGNVSGLIGALSLTTKDGSSIPVENLSEDIEILLPRPVGEQVNTSVLDLGNFSTTVIDISSVNSTLVLKMVPSSDPLPFKLFLGYLEYPTDKNYVAMTQMPHQGTTQEERYTWLLEPKDLKGNTGVHYLLVRPIVGPGIKSIKANLSITPITSECKFWDESILDWRTNGCRVGIRSTHLVTQCLCNHLTFFGSSFFVTPNLVDPSRSAELFATFADNPVVVCFVGALCVVYLLAVVWARRKDIQDVAKVKVTVLEDNDPMDEYRYLLSVSTGYRRGASTSSQVTITLLGAEGNSEPHHLTDPKKPVFERGAVDVFLITAPFSLGDLQGIRLWHNNSGSHPAWYVGNVMVQDLQTEQKWHFLCNSWLAIDVGDCSLDKVFPVSTEMDLKRFSNLFFMKTTKDFSDGHLWYSVISRPASSTFTCVQRVSCCFSLLLCTMLTSIMFYGIPTDPSEQTMDLGHFEFTWQQFMIGVQSSLIMFPINILIVSIFRYTRPRETSCCRRKTEKPDALEQTSSSETATTNVNVNVTLETLIKDITRIIHSLSKNMKSNIPPAESEFGPGQQVDINAVLAVVEDFIKQNSKTSDTTESKTQLPEGSASMHPRSAVEGIQKKSNKTQYLYRQLCHIDKELSLLGPSGFPTPHSYSQALQQVQGMKGSLEDQLFKFSCVDPDEPTQKKLTPADSTDGDGSQKKRACCHGGLPWWFIFFGWLLVIATSGVSGYFTMLYGLNFGKERSISWLVSMIVSFFQSILVIQPLKVLCLAVFFALVIKKVDEEDFQNVAFEGNDRNLGKKDPKHMIRQDSRLYQPPPPADIERMRRNKILEQKAFALLREILVYMGFMWMLLLVAYGQRDPNAFFLNQHIRKSFSRNISDSMSLGDVFTWANTSLLSHLFGVYPGFITDGNSKLVGNARLRQLRVQKDSCQIAGSTLHLVPDCHAPYSWEVEDTGTYDLGWNHSVGGNVSTSAFSPWKYQTQAQLRAQPVWGRMVLYRGGGFVAELGPDSQNASSTLAYLFTNKWLDMYTRAIFVEFTVYNANVNLFCIVKLLFETTAIGAFRFNSELQTVRLYQSTGGLHIFVMAAEIIYMLFIIYYMFLQGKSMKQQRWAYFRNKWNLLELTIILLSWSAVAVFIKRTLLGSRDMTHYQNHKDQFPSFYETATADSVLQYLIAFLVLLATVKLWHLFRLNPKINMITATLQQAWSDISSFLVIIVIMLVAYSIACNVIYGWKTSSYRTFANSLVAIISLQIGIFNYDEVLNADPLLGGLLIGSCTVFVTFVVLNLLISVILMAFNQEQIYHKPSDEEEIVDLMLKKIFSLFGISYKNTKDILGPDGNASSGLALNNSRNILNNSSVDENTFQTSDNSQTVEVGVVISQLQERERCGVGAWLMRVVSGLISSYRKSLVEVIAAKGGSAPPPPCSCSDWQQLQSIDDQGLVLKSSEIAAGQILVCPAVVAASLESKHP
ncbi:polycystin-1-like protein 2 [Symphorus nematophorus]